MPNHYQVVGLAARNWHRMEIEGDKDSDDIDLASLNGANLCKIIAPLPEGLQGIVAGNPRYRSRHKLTGELSTDCNGQMGAEREQWERVELSDEEVATLRQTFGAADWYEWQCANWGTKWGTYSTKAETLDGDGSPVRIEFQSAWGPPSPQMMARINSYLCRKYMLKNILWVGHDPANSSTAVIPTDASTEADDKLLLSWCVGCKSIQVHTKHPMRNGERASKSCNRCYFRTKGWEQVQVPTRDASTDADA